MVEIQLTSNNNEVLLSYKCVFKIKLLYKKTHILFHRIVLEILFISKKTQFLLPYNCVLDIKFLSKTHKFYYPRNLCLKLN